MVDKASENSSFQVLITGEATLEAEINEIAAKDLAIGEGIGISVALVVLALVLARIHRRTPMDGVRTAEGGG